MSPWPGEHGTPDEVQRLSDPLESLERTRAEIERRVIAPAVARAVARAEDLLRRLLHEVVYLDERERAATDSDGYRTMDLTPEDMEYLKALRDREQ